MKHTKLAISLKPLAIAVVAALGVGAGSAAWAGGVAASAALAATNRPVAPGAGGSGTIPETIGVSPVQRRAVAGHDSAQQTTQNNQNADQQKQKSSQKQAKRKKKNEAKTTTLAAITVIGFSGSVQNSTAIKRNSNSIVEAVSSERIGELPGSSIGASLGRLPGIAVQLSSGRSSNLSIHGLGPEFATVLINGNRQASTENNRAVDLNNYPTSWFQSVVVHLSPSASLVGGGMAGTVNMHTIQPLDAGKMHVALNARYIRNSNGRLFPGSALPHSQPHGYDVNGLFVDQLFNHTFGVTFGIDLQSSPATMKAQSDSAPDSFRPAPGTGPNGPSVLHDTLSTVRSDLQKRHSVLLTLQWEPADWFTSTLNTNYARLRSSPTWAGPEVKVTPGVTVTYDPSSVINGIATKGTFHNVQLDTRTGYYKLAQSVWNLSWKNQIQFSPNWSSEIGAAYSRAESTEQTENDQGGYGINLTGPTTDVPFVEHADGLITFAPTQSITRPGFMVTDVLGFGLGANPPVIQAGFRNLFATNDYIHRAYLRLRRSFISGPISSLQFGFAAKKRHKAYTLHQWFLIPPPGETSLPLPGSAATTGKIDFVGFPSVYVYNPYEVFTDPASFFATSLSSLSKPPDWGVTERDKIAFVQANIDTNIGSVALRGNFGVQFLHTKQQSAGHTVVAPTHFTGSSSLKLVPVTGGAQYNIWLPSFNLVFGLTSNDDLRLSAAKSISRPEMSDMTASSAIVTNRGELTSKDPANAYFSGAGGNPALKPTRATNFNVSYEHYFGRGTGFSCGVGGGRASSLCRSGVGQGGFVAVSGYYLKLKDWINEDATVTRDFTSVLSDYLTPAAQQQLGTPLGDVVGPRNDGNGHVQGVQASANVPLSVIYRPLSGFGVLASATYSKSAITIGGSPSAIPLPGLSKWVTHATVYYAHGGFQARVTRTYRSSFLAQTAGNSGALIFLDFKGSAHYAAQVSYTWYSGALKGLSIVAQGANLTNEKQVEFEKGNPWDVASYNDFGRTFTIGVSYQF